MKTLVEIVCQSVADVRAAQNGGADRIELCTALAGAGGLTPTLALLEHVKNATMLPVVAMVRPRAGGFCYDADEQRVLERDAQSLLENSADGLVFGILEADGRVNVGGCQPVVDRARHLKREAVFHRAFDVTPDPFEALDTLIHIGFTRLLTSGQARTAWQGAELIARLRQRAAGRIEILPGGGVRASNARELVARTGCDQLHLAPVLPVTDPTANGNSASYGAHDRVDEQAVRAVVAVLAEPD